MKRGLVWFLMAWMMMLTVWTGVLAVAVLDRDPASVAFARSDLLDVRDRVVVRWETPPGTTAGSEVLPPRTMPLWQYVESGPKATDERLAAFERAFERDLASGDSTFHETHEIIDGRDW
jgi:hypothetical protein